MSDNIPFDIQSEIIKKVSDVKALIRCRSVSKHWKAYIDSSKFISGYGIRDTQPHRLLLRYKQPGYFLDPEIKYISFVNDVTFPEQEEDFSVKVPLFIKKLYNSKVIGSSCGLWCFHDFESDSSKEMFVFWNPSIRKSLGIVVPSLLTRSSAKMTHFGFGVRTSTFDPTIVGVSWYFQECEYKVGIFTLSSKIWKMIPSSNMPRESIRLGRSPTQVAIDRFIFWVSGIVGDSGVYVFKSLILSFDLISHEFKEYNLPVSIADSPSISISKLNESLVASAYTNEVNGLVYNVWMMGEEGGVMASFTKLFTIKTPDDLLVHIVLGFTKSGEPIMETLDEYADYPGVYIYKQMIFTGIEAECGSFFVSPYAETLLLLDHSDCCIGSNDS